MQTSSVAGRRNFGAEEGTLVAVLLKLRGLRESRRRIRCQRTAAEMLSRRSQAMLCSPLAARPLGPFDCMRKGMEMRQQFLPVIPSDSAIEYGRLIMPTALPIKDPSQQKVDRETKRAIAFLPARSLSCLCSCNSFHETIPPPTSRSSSPPERHPLSTAKHQQLLSNSFQSFV